MIHPFVALFPKIAFKQTLNISRHINMAKPEEIIDLQAVHKELMAIENALQKARESHNGFLRELRLPEI